MPDQPNDITKTLNTTDAGSVGFAVPPGTPADDDPEKPFGVEERVTVISTGEPARVASVVKSPGGQFIYRVKIIDANNVVKGFAVCMQDDLKRRGMRAMKRLQTPEQLTLIVPVQRAVNALYQEYQKGRVNPQPINNILRLLARADAKQDVLPRTDRQGIPLVRKDLVRALRAAAAYNAGSRKDLATAIYALDLALTTLNQMLGGSAPPMPRIPRPAAASVRKGVSQTMTPGDVVSLDGAARQTQRIWNAQGDARKVHILLNRLYQVRRFPPSFENVLVPAMQAATRAERDPAQRAGLDQALQRMVDALDAIQPDAPRDDWRLGSRKSRLGDSLPPQISPNEMNTRAQTLTAMRQAFLNSYRDASQDTGYHRNNPMLQGGRNLPPLITPEVARQKIQEFITNNSGARFGATLPIRIGEFRTQIYTLAKQAGFAAGIRVLFGQKPVGTVNSTTLVKIANDLLNAHADKVDAYALQRRKRQQES